MKKSIHLLLSSLIALVAPTTTLFTYSHPVGAVEFSDQIDSIGDHITDTPGEDYWNDDYLIDIYPIPFPDLGEDYWEDSYLIDRYPIPFPDLGEDYWEDSYLIDRYPMPLPDGPIDFDPIYEYFPSENGNVDRTLCINCRSLSSDPVPLSTSIPEPSNLLGHIILGGMMLGGAIKSRKK
jgi:hypothetical protein